MGVSQIRRQGPLAVSKDKTASSESVRGCEYSPSDPSIGLAALVLGALATGRTRITGLRDSEDAMSTIAALGALGVPVSKVGDTWEVLGRGAGGLCQPSCSLDLGRSEIAATLIIGALAGQPITAKLSCELQRSASATRRVLEPLQSMGLEVLEGSAEAFSLTVRGSRTLLPISFEFGGDPAGAEWAIVLAGIAAPGETTISLNDARGSHEAMLRSFGAKVSVAKTGSRLAITLTGETELSGADIVLPVEF